MVGGAPGSVFKISILKRVFVALTNAWKIYLKLFIQWKLLIKWQQIIKSDITNWITELRFPEFLCNLQRIAWSAGASDARLRFNKLHPCTLWFTFACVEYSLGYLLLHEKKPCFRPHTTDSRRWKLFSHRSIIQLGFWWWVRCPSQCSFSGSRPSAWSRCFHPHRFNTQ